MSKKLLSQLIEYQGMLKMFHFHTKHFAAHKASDDLHEDLDDLIDKYFESAQGASHRIGNFTTQIRFGTMTDSDFLSYTKILMKHLALYSKKQTSELSNILDEIHARLEKFIYLLTFK